MYTQLLIIYIYVYTWFFVAGEEGVASCFEYDGKGRAEAGFYLFFLIFFCFEYHRKGRRAAGTGSQKALSLVTKCADFFL